MSNAERGARMLELARQLIETAGYDPWVPVCASGEIYELATKGGDGMYSLAESCRHVAGLVCELVEYCNPSNESYGLWARSTGHIPPGRCGIKLAILPGKTYDEGEQYL